MSTKNGTGIAIHSVINCTPKDIGVENPQPANNLYHIFLSVETDKMFTEEEYQVRRYAATVIASDLEDAFRQAQQENPDYAEKRVRSCAVGDLIQDQEGFYMVCASGFKLICLLETGHD